MQHWIDRSGIAHRPPPAPYSGPQLTVGDAAARLASVGMIKPRAVGAPFGEARSFGVGMSSLTCPKQCRPFGLCY